MLTKYKWNINFFFNSISVSWGAAGKSRPQNKLVCAGAPKTVDPACVLDAILGPRLEMLSCTNQRNQTSELMEMVSVVEL
jgi:hypothetical protein